jgi:hypothetical protein
MTSKNGWREDEPRIHLPTHHDWRNCGGGHEASERIGTGKTALETTPLNQFGRGAELHHRTDTTAKKPIHQVTYGKSMRSVQEIMREGTGIKVLSRKDVGEAVRAAKAKKTEFTSFWTRKRGKATK